MTVLSKPCPWHRRKELGYIAWHEWAERMVKRGSKQRLCPDCKRWLFPIEFGRKPRSVA